MKFAINPNVISSVLGDELILLDMDSGLYLKLNSSASLVWDFLKEGDSKESIYTRLKKIYPNYSIEKDLDIFFDDAIKKGLLKEVK